MVELASNTPEHNSKFFQADGVCVTGESPGPDSTIIPLSTFSVPLAIILLAVLVYKSVERLIFFRHVRRGSRVARVAAATLRELRASTPDAYSSTHHTWCAVTEGHGSAPLLCVACVGHIRVSPTDTLQRCAACGVVSHDSCLRHVGDTCRPLATPPGIQNHFWLVSGTSLEESSNVDRPSSAAVPCLYCNQAIAGELYAGEPTWRCSCCACCAHVECFSLAHPELPAVSAAATLQRQRKTRDGVTLGSESVAAIFEDTISSPRKRARLQAVATARSNLAALDTCSLGLVGRLVLPSSCVRYIRSKDRKSEGKEVNGTSDDKKSHLANGAEPPPPSPTAGDALMQQQQQQQDASTRVLQNSTSRRSKNPLQKQVSTSRRGSWWRRAFASRPLQWQDWTISSLPPHCRPVVVFISARSGPQVGDMLRRRFLRILHPLQVVSLPRDSPEPALRLFASVPGTRILCVGGDGTVGWIMSCLDSLAEEFRQRGRRETEGEGGETSNSETENGNGVGLIEWVPPPVAVMPLGTGNDLARCLGWGGGYAAWRNEGIATVLTEVAQAAVGLLDRWTLTFIETAPVENQRPIPISAASSALQLLSPRGKSTAAGAASKFPQVTTKAMNNYLGVGVDAKVALEFHEMREAYPQWFQSQIGNKLVYTGVGALDIVGGGQLDLPSKLRIECDGQEVSLPPGAEGVLIVNIPSYMGGVDLWASGGTSGESQDHSADESSSGTHRQSLCDGWLELVAVYGSWHLGQLTVGLSGAVRLRQARRVVLRAAESLPMQVDGEPFMQGAGEVIVEHRGHTRVLRRVASKPVARVVRAVEDALDTAAQSGVITAAQHNAVSQEVAARLSQL